MQVLYPRCAGLDVHKDTIVACVRCVSQPMHQEVRSFGATTAELLELADWLAEHDCTHVAMEATGVYWKPVWHVLEDEFELVLANAAHIRNVPGRKTDVNDAMWIADLLAHGLIRSSFVPPQAIQQLRDLTRTRKLHRDRRTRAPWPTIALVGYTNAGKSSLFNLLTGASVMAEDLLFATLDPTMRQIALPGIEKAILSDTVGFVSELPTQLVAAFHATLEEVIDADIIVHVRDIAHPDTEAQREDVIRVMAEIGAGGEEGAPVIEAWNKIDLLDPETRAIRDAEAARRDDVVLISALSGEGVDALAQHLSGGLTSAHRIREIELGMADGAAIAWLHANGTVEEETLSGERLTLKVRLSDVDFARFQARSFS